VVGRVKHDRLHPKYWPKTELVETPPKSIVTVTYGGGGGGVAPPSQATAEREKCPHLDIPIVFSPGSVMGSESREEGLQCLLVLARGGRGRERAGNMTRRQSILVGSICASARPSERP
jgi:hypothetical protein